MPRKVKCRYCNEFLTIDEAIILSKQNSKGNLIKIFLHKKCEQDYNELMEYKENEIKWFDELYEHIKGVLAYTKEQQLPRYLITRLQDLRNGTVMQRGVGRVIKQKEGYKYDVILNTFLTCGDDIRWSIGNKSFKNEHQRINYMMAIIENNINDIYIGMQRNQSVKNIEKRNDLIEEENINIQINKQIKINKGKKGISKFLEDDEL
ncbi:hypothetical protein IRP63_14225 (plasmid) [Clostridium botulinum]|uniref:Uncharacterized protein n=1 Tax=Clostridium botulinum C/D str. DC5 TaxID=1443128 RepID=A0A0A0HZN7_CLOBO|nr:hypothetical protein [Clostridium botulinum]KGM93546.1 hypothetical protein Z955_14910 [Clostridium botulinum C/D str. DC5]KOC56854.1 hypothetical protein ADU89_01255 [Clostridium botulinum]KOC57329.1 hypothetical protein ADU90_05795 [Clostridium botulinum]MCD3232558.1 hypothetical protein [Clostridium botulinum D/C]MCD3238513.1 hypothetical protein [Clostridium botulinum D/C]